MISSCAGNFFYLTIGGMNVSSRTIRLKPASVSDNGKGSVVFLLPLLSFSIDELLGRALLLFDLLKVSVCMIYTLTVFFFISLMQILNLWTTESPKQEPVRLLACFRLDHERALEKYFSLVFMSYLALTTHLG